MKADLKMTADELNRFLDDEFPQLGGQLVVEHVSTGDVRTRMRIDERHLRPGGTVSGPSLFTLADCAFYVAVLSRIGPVALTVTTSCSINFLRKPTPTDIVADARILKLGRSLCVGDVLVTNVGDPRVVAQASLTYSIPPAKNRV